MVLSSHVITSLDPPEDEVAVYLVGEGLEMTEICCDQ